MYCFPSHFSSPPLSSFPCTLPPFSRCSLPSRSLPPLSPSPFTRPPLNHVPPSSSVFPLPLHVTFLSFSLCQYIMSHYYCHVTSSLSLLSSHRHHIVIWSYRSIFIVLMSLHCPQGRIQKMRAPVLLKNPGPPHVFLPLPHCSRLQPHPTPIRCYHSYAHHECFCKKILKTIRKAFFG